MNNGTYQQQSEGPDDNNHRRRDEMDNGLPRRERTLGGYGGDHGAGHEHTQSQGGSEQGGENAQRRPTRPTRPNMDWSGHSRSRDNSRRHGGMRSGGIGQGSRHLEG